MAEKKTKLELTWIGKENQPRLEPRILLEDPELSYSAKQRVGDDDIFDNILIHGDNLLALRALEQDFAGKVKCIYIDPPFNTGSAFEHYDDGIEHSIWLGLMRDRLELLKRLLRPDGFICCHIDDSEGHYLKVVMDEVFGRPNYLTTLYVQVRYPEKTLKQDMAFHKEIEQVHVYRREYGARPNQNEVASSFDKFKFYVTEKGSGRKIDLGGRLVTVFDASEYDITEGEGGPNGLKEIWATGTILDGNSSGRFFRDFIAGRVDQDGLGVLYKVPGIGDDQFGFRYFTGPKRASATKGKYFQGVPRNQLASPDEVKFTPIENFYDLAAQFGNCRHEGGVEFRGGKKPERLLEIVLRHFSNPGDLVLDSFAGSGTTASVAHKMRRRWITIEAGEQAVTHCVPRLRKVIGGEDLTGVTEIVAWKGGGGFRCYHLAPSLLQEDKWGNWVINKTYNKEMLAEAMCKLQGFRYAPSPSVFWLHGQSSEQDFIYVTTQTLTSEQLEVISAEVGPDRTLLICCAAFRANHDLFPNLTITKIPAAVLARCEWGKDDYSLNVQNVMGEDPESPPDPNANGDTPSIGKTKRNKKAPKVQDLMPLFASISKGGEE